MNRILREPLVHFFSLAAVLFIIHRWVVGSPRTIELSSATRAAIVRRFNDQRGHAPTPAEQAAAVRDWEQDEALYREALRDRLDQDDTDVRNVLITKVRNRAALEAPKREPTTADLDQWLATHRSLYETPRRYAIEWVSFPKQDPAAGEQRDQFEHAAHTGADIRFLGRPIYGATLTTDAVAEKLGNALSEAIPAFPRAAWQRAESDSELLLVRVNQIEGGLPNPEELHARLVTDWTTDQRAKDAARNITKIVDRYHFDEHR